jgi:8-oxo-dGTP pyrophosphatase MutT (NUDIX family)
MAGNWLSLFGPKIKPVLFPYWLLSRGVTLGVRCAAFDDQGAVCLVKHTYTPGWHFPGGGVEPGETALQAVKKELSEEAGIVLQAPPELFAVYANFTASRRDNVVMFVARNWQQMDLKLPSREIAEIGTFDPLDPPADISPGTRRRLAEIAEGEASATVW